MPCRTHTLMKGGYDSTLACADVAIQHQLEDSMFQVYTQKIHWCPYEMKHLDVSVT